VRVGIMGGSFDPPHVGHLLAATDAYDALRLDRLVFVPAGTQPLKPGAAQASPAARLAMVRLLIARDERFEVDPIEIERAGLSYTVETLEAFAGRMPSAERFFLIGADVPATFRQWRDPERIAELAHIVVLRRGDDAVADLPPTLAGGQVLATRRVDVSSTEIRERLQRGMSIRGFVPESVARYIATEGLYR
jgi:nicotinate-nucleotide adenylyltransferase